jgi:transcriptional regulator with XRE-family HTH domain
MKVKMKPGIIRSLLDEKGLWKHYRTMAKEMNCALGAVSDYINEKVQEPSALMLLRWSRYLGVTMEDLIVLVDDNEDDDEVEDKRRPPTLKGCEANLHQLSFPH